MHTVQARVNPISDVTLPERMPADCPVGCSAVSQSRGFSARLMWRSRGRLVTYAYYPDKV